MRDVTQKPAPSRRGRRGRPLSRATSSSEAGEDVSDSGFESGHDGGQAAARTAETEARQHAVARRDRASDGIFWYAVTTTGIYCRPSCPSKRPRPGHIKFYDTTAAARADGFRPCRRCAPDVAGSIDDANARRISAACRLIEATEAPLKLVDIAREVGLSPHHFHRLFKEALGLTPKAYAEELRRARMRDALTAGIAVTNAVHDAGYQSASRFYAKADEILGMQPSAYRKGGESDVIRYALGIATLGHVLVAETSRGLCAILLGGTPVPLEDDLRRRFPRATISRDEAGLKRTFQSVISLVDHPSRGVELPLDIRGTAFQHRVWQALRRIPAGETRTYSEIAELIGAEKAVRAVAQACAANPLAVAVPCHRVVRSDGQLSGYRWGLQRKSALLEREGTTVASAKKKADGTAPAQRPKR
ncbi:MAG: bifunctional DNA-binding transcriptional regulator/O6-methylguanine-DNA methyltransferase Ada [Hyphomicrobiaceae bacterium]|nr:bifunctional DNA-binding transcriptional regulator/O6-methylguanine-DNA methyltransferase Ada [Hyphomicrobiaceae bacterium]